MDVSGWPNQHNRMISKGSSDTEALKTALNSALPSNKLIVF